MSAVASIGMTGTTRIVPRLCQVGPKLRYSGDESRVQRDEGRRAGGQMTAIGDGWRMGIAAGHHRGLDGPHHPVDSSSMDRGARRISPLRILSVATMFGIFSALQAFNYVKLFDDHERPFYVLLALNVTYWYAWAVLVPGMLWMARRYRIERNTWKRAAAMH